VSRKRSPAKWRGFTILLKSAIQLGPVESAATNLHFHLWALVSSAAVDLVCFQRTLDVAFERKELKLFKQFLRHSSCEYDMTRDILIQPLSYRDIHQIMFTKDATWMLTKTYGICRGIAGLTVTLVLECDISNADYILLSPAHHYSSPNDMQK
jgi:hypothetical protein